MKTTLLLLVGTALLGSACQHTPDSTAATAAPLTTPTARPVSNRQPAPVAPASPLTSQQLAILRQYDLAPVLLPPSYQDEEGNRQPGQIMNGFFGAEHRRIEFVFTRVERDARNPALFHISGKDRLKQHITPLEGTIELTGLAPLKIDTDVDPVQPAGYAATGTFVLRETGDQSGTGVFRGRVALDFNIDEAHRPALAMWGYLDTSMAAQGAGSRFEGTWTSNRTGQAKPVLWADGAGLFAIASDVLADFNVGERGPSINPKYAKLGWDNYWENDEWWAESPKTATVSL